MADVINLTKARKANRRAKARGKTLCRSGHHKWAIDQTKQFDVKRGKLVTVKRCTRCGATSVQAR